MPPPALHSQNRPSKMKKLISSLFISIFICLGANAQKVTYNKGVVMRGDSIACFVEPMGVLLSKSYSFKNSDGQELVFFKRRIVQSPEIDKTTGVAETITYFEIHIKGVECFAEIGENELGFAMMSEKKTILKLAEYIFSDRVIIADQIDVEAAAYFCQKMGAPYADAIARLEYKYEQPVVFIQ
jgi:hypothetical protein